MHGLKRDRVNLVYVNVLFDSIHPDIGYSRGDTVGNRISIQSTEKECFYFDGSKNTFKTVGKLFSLSIRSMINEFLRRRKGMQVFSKVKDRWDV